MTAQKGKNIVLKIGDGGSPAESFTTVAGLQMTRMAIGQQIIDASHVAGGAWRQVGDASGSRQMSISGEGVFEDSAAEESLRAKAFGGNSANYELRFGNGDKIAGAFMVSSYLQQGEVQDAQHFMLTLESAGAISFVAG